MPVKRQQQQPTACLLPCNPITVFLMFFSIDNKNNSVYCVLKLTAKADDWVTLLPTEEQFHMGSYATCIASGNGALHFILRYPVDALFQLLIICCFSQFTWRYEHQSRCHTILTVTSHPQNTLLDSIVPIIFVARKEERQKQTHSEAGRVGIANWNVMRVVAFRWRQKPARDARSVKWIDRNGSHTRGKDCDLLCFNRPKMPTYKSL